MIAKILIGKSRAKHSVSVECEASWLVSELITEARKLAPAPIPKILQYAEGTGSEVLLYLTPIGPRMDSDRTLKYYQLAEDCSLYLVCAAPPKRVRENSVLTD